MESFVDNLLSASTTQQQGSIFYLTLLGAAIAFLVFESLGLVKRLRRPKPTIFPTGRRPGGIEIEAVWTLIPGVVLLLLTVVHLRTGFSPRSRKIGVVPKPTPVQSVKFEAPRKGHEQ